MENLTPIELLVNKKVYADIMQKGFAEITQRRKDAKFIEMVKSPIFFEKVTENSTNNLIAQESLKMTNNQSNIRRIINELGLGKASVNELTVTTKNIASQVNGLGMMMESVQSLEYLNVGLNLANISLDVAGFAMVLNKLDKMEKSLKGLRNEIESLSNHLSDIAASQWGEKKEEYQKLSWRCKNLVFDIKKKKDVSTKRIEDMIIDLMGFFSYIQDAFSENRFDQESLLKMMITLLPVYSFLVDQDIERRFYDDNGAVPPSYEDYIAVYNYYASSTFRERLEDFLILEKGLHLIDATDIVNTWSLFALNGRVQNEDKLSILQEFKTKELVSSYERTVDDMVKIEIKEKVPIIAKSANCDESDVLRYFQMNE